jgi:hypothetical protein
VLHLASDMLWLCDLLHCTAPSATGVKGSKSDGNMEKHYSSVDSSWNCHFDDELSQTRQLMRWDLVPECSTRIMRSPTWNRSSTPGMYNLGKWLAEGVDLGIQMSPSLGIPRCLSASSGATLLKVGGVVVLRLKL